MISLYFLFFMLVLFSYFFNYNFFLNSLLYLESISLLIFFIMFSCLSYLSSVKIMLLYLVFVVIESSLGLSVLVKLTKISSDNNFRSLNLTLF